MKKLTLCSAIFLSSLALANGGVAHYDVIAVDQAPDLNAPYNAQYWQAVPEISGSFHYPWRDFAPPKTTFKAVHDDKNIYMVFVADEPDVVIIDAPEETSVAKGDRVEVFFAPENVEKPSTRVKGLPSYYGLEIDPNGKVLDYEAKYYRHLDNKWNMPNLRTTGEIKEGEYIVRIEIPLEELEKLDLLQEDGTIQAGVFRAQYVPNGDKNDAHWITWVNPNTAKPDFHVNSAFGQFRLLKK